MVRRHKTDYEVLVRLALHRSKSRHSCPLWVSSAHHPVTLQCPLYHQKRTKSDTAGMSALCHKRTHAPQQTASLFDLLVGEQQERLGDGQPHRLRGLEVDHQLELR